MKIYIIDGTFDESYSELVKKFFSKLSKFHQVKISKIRDLNISYCTGCWDCWVKTPGICAHKDDTPLHVSNMVNSDVVLHITESSLGTITSLTKKALDKAIPTIHPYLTIVDGESRHMKRYDTYAKWGLIFIDPDQDKTDYDNVVNYFKRAVMNAKTELSFHDSLSGKEDSIDETNTIKWFA